MFNQEQGFRIPIKIITTFEVAKIFRIVQVQIAVSDVVLTFFYFCFAILISLFQKVCFSCRCYEERLLAFNMIS